MALSVFLRDAPVVFPGYGVDERMILVVLSISTVVLLTLTHATVFLAELAVGLVVVVLHGAFRRTDDLFSDEEQGVKSDVSVDLKESFCFLFFTVLESNIYECVRACNVVGLWH